MKELVNRNVRSCCVYESDDDIRLNVMDMMKLI
jgi:hypothetical protein